MIKTPIKNREKGIIRFYSSEQGKGYITAGNHDYQFQVTDVVGTLPPRLGDRVVFSPQLVNEHQLARKVVLERDPQFIDNPGSGAARGRTQELKRQVAPKKPAIHGKIAPSAAAHLQCQSCRRVMSPKRVRSRFRFPGLGTPRWHCYCPHCGTRQLETGRSAPKPARLLLGLLLAGLLIGAGLGLF